jgi:CDP-diacylglycerol---glycerol-3-phosphate 3-phosphatidyltransferase
MPFGHPTAADAGGVRARYGRRLVLATDFVPEITNLAVFLTRRRPRLRCHRMPTAFRRQLPNALTLLRVILAGAFFAALNAFRYPDHKPAWGNIAIALFIIAAITDALDGYLARKWKVESVFGRLMDPFCDKVLILGAFIYLTGPRFTVPEWVEEKSYFTMATGVYPWMVVLILARELLVTGIRGIIEGMGMSGASNWSGKAKMILQSIAVPIVLFLVINFRPSEQAWARYTCTGLIYLTLFVTVWSGMPYITGLRRIMINPSKATAKP